MATYLKNDYELSSLSVAMIRSICLQDSLSKLSTSQAMYGKLPDLLREFYQAQSNDDARNIANSIQVELQTNYFNSSSQINSPQLLEDLIMKETQDDTSTIARTLQKLIYNKSSPSPFTIKLLETPGTSMLGS